MGFFDDVVNIFSLGAIGSDHGGRENSAAALNQYDTATASTRDAILKDTSIDNISRQELLDALADKRNTVGKDSSSDPNDVNNIINFEIASLNSGLTNARGDNPIYKGRRFAQDMAEQEADRPGRAQVMLSQRDTTQGGTPTLLTSTPGADLVPQANTLLGGT